MKCSAFWKHTNIRPGNRVYPCCRFKHSIGSFDGDIGSVLQTYEYKELRRASEAGEWISGCEKCYYEESIGHKSLRQEFNEKYSAETVKLEYLEIGIDNLCNMACDGCNSEFSTRWIAKEEKLYGKSKHKFLESSEIDNVPDSIKKILFLGGEPLLTEKHLSVLEKHSNPSICDLVYNTNGSIIPDKNCVTEWQRFRSVSFILSIDGYGSVNDKVREGSKWQEILDFIEWCESNQYDFEVNTVVHKNNLFSLADLSDFVWQHTDKWYVNVLTYPQHLDIVTLDEKTLDKFIDSLKGKKIPNYNFIENHINNKNN